MLTARFKRYRESLRRNPAARNRAGIPEEKVKKMDQNQLLQIALEQSARDYGCAPGDFLRQDPMTILSEPHEGARVYLPLPIACSLVSYGNNVVAQTSEPLLDKVLAFLRRYPAEHCFETPNLYVLNDILAPYGQKLCFMGEYFLPDLSRLQELPCSCRVKLLTPEDFAGLYLPQWSNALCENAGNGMCWRSAHTTEKRSSDLREPRRTAIPCTKSALTFFPLTGGKGLPPH